MPKASDRTADHGLDPVALGQRRVQPLNDVVFRSHARGSRMRETALSDSSAPQAILAGGDAQGKTNPAGAKPCHLQHIAAARAARHGGSQLVGRTGRRYTTSPPITVMSGVIFQMSSAGMVM